MSETADTVLAYWLEHRQQLRQSENQRATLTNYILVIVAAITGFIVQQGMKVGTIPLSVFIMAMGGYGAIAVAKYHERATYHLSQARALTQTLVDIGALPDNKTKLDATRQTHYAKYRLLRRVRLHSLWTGLHIGIALYGASLLTVTLTR
jgi:hypothetical protein